MILHCHCHYKCYWDIMTLGGKLGRSNVSWEGRKFWKCLTTNKHECTDLLTLSITFFHCYHHFCCAVLWQHWEASWGSWMGVREVNGCGSMTYKYSKILQHFTKSVLTFISTLQHHSRCIHYYCMSCGIKGAIGEVKWAFRGLMEMGGWAGDFFKFLQSNKTAKEHKYYQTVFAWIKMKVLMEGVTESLLWQISAGC